MPPRACGARAAAARRALARCWPAGRALARPHVEHDAGVLVLESSKSPNIAHTHTDGVISFDPVVVT